MPELDAAGSTSIAAHRGSDIGEIVSTVVESARSDASSGWLTAMFNVARYEVGDHASVVCGYRGEEASVVDGQLAGRWASVVGAVHADWLLLAVGGGQRALVDRGQVRIDSAHRPSGLVGAGLGDVTAEGIRPERILPPPTDDVVTLTAASMVAALVGSADGLWRHHVDLIKDLLATSHGGQEAGEQATAQLAWAASDIDAATLQVMASLRLTDRAAAQRAHRQAAARARDAADRIMSCGRHALAATDPVTGRWRDVQTGYRLAERFLTDPD